MAPKKRTTRASPATTTTTTTPVTNAQLKALIDQGIADASAARDADRTMNGDDSHNSGTGVRRQAPLARECTYTDFIKYKPLYFKGTEGVVELTQWFERMETVFRISNYTVENQIKFATCTLLGSALTWWNAHVRTVGHDVAYAMTWTNLKKMMTDNYCPRDEIKKLEVEMWNLKVKGTDVVGYNQCFQELELMCAMMFPEESDKIEKYVGSSPDMIHGSVMASKPKTMQDAIEFSTELMDKKISTLAKRQAENKRKLDNNNQEARCGYSLYRWCANCKRVGHLTQDCKSPAATNNKRNLTCYKCGNQGHYKSDCSELKNQNYGNQAVGKENGEMLIDSIKNGPVKLLPEITIKDTDGVTDIRRPQKVADLSQKEKLRYDSDIRAVNIILLGLLVEITLFSDYKRYMGSSQQTYGRHRDNQT
ncbi:reverse transcriptase domain-containing protein [Tanacetum coccineum]